MAYVLQGLSGSPAELLLFGLDTVGEGAGGYVTLGTGQPVARHLLFGLYGAAVAPAPDSASGAGHAMRGVDLGREELPEEVEPDLAAARALIDRLTGAARRAAQEAIEAATDGPSPSLVGPDGALVALAAALAIVARAPAVAPTPPEGLLAAPPADEPSGASGAPEPSGLALAVAQLDAALEAEARRKADNRRRAAILVALMMD